MDKEALEEWIKNRLHDISKQASSVKPDFFPERIHELRTETKKLRAMMRLIGMESGEDPRLPKAFKKAYRAAGAIRDKQMQLQFVAADKRQALPVFAVWLAHETGNAARAWKHDYDESALQDLEKEIADHTIPDLQLQTLGIYLREHQQKIAELTQSEPDDDALHEIRKLSKDMGYIVSFCRKSWPEAWSLVQPLEKVLERLSDKAGAYNDRRNLLASLVKFQLHWGKELDDDTQGKVSKAENDWTASKTKEHTRLLAAIRQLCARKIRV